MITTESILSMDKGALQEAAKSLSNDDILQLVEWLALQDDNLRYRAFLLLQNRSISCSDVYPYWNAFRDKLTSDTSYQRSIGLMLLAANAKWDTENRMAYTIDEYLERLHDEKPITVRQCIQGLAQIVPYQPDVLGKIAEILISFNLLEIKETMRKSILMDIVNVLLSIRKDFWTDELEGYIRKALSDEVLDKRSKKQIEAFL